MHRFPLFILLALVISLFTPPQMEAQHYIRRVWQADFGAPALTDWSASIWTADKKLITVGNTASSGGQTGMLTTVQNAEGQILWSKTWFHLGSSASHSYGICAAVDSAGNIYAGGASQDSLGAGFDMAVVKYDTAGTEIWSVLLGDSGDDYPAALAFVPGDTLLYLAGASAAENDTLDYLTIQLSTQTGGIVWERRYDYAGLEDVPVALSVDSSNNVVITGGSASDPGNWEVATLKYGKSSGNLLAEAREGLESSLDEPAGLSRSADGDFFIAGNMKPIGQPGFIRVWKLDEGLNLVWESDYWGDTLGCEARALGLDEQGRVWVGGRVMEPGGRLSPLVIRMEAAGGEILGERKWNFHDKPEAEIRYLACGAGGGMYALGQSGLEGPGQVFLTRLNGSGVPYWEHSLSGLAKASGLQRADSVGVVLAVAYYGQDTVRYKTMRYEENSLGGWPVYNEDGDPLYMSNRVIVRFNPGIMNLGFVNDPGQEYGKLSDAVTSTTLPLLIDSILGVQQGISADWYVYKIFPFWNASTQTITSRLGEEVPLPKLWSALVLKVGSATVTNPVEVSDSLQKLPYTYIRYAHPTFLGDLAGIPNDPYLGEQFHLWDTTSAGEYIDAHIGMDSVWTQYAWDTSRIVRAGVFDSGVHFTHEDFRCDNACPPQTLNGTVVYLNKDFYVNPSGNYNISPNEILDLADEVGGHGTNVAGLLGAISNNGIGISGVAGGDFGSGISGVLLQNYRVLDSTNIDIAAVSSAIGWAIDYGVVDLMNSSFGFENQGQWSYNQNLLREIYRLAYRASIVAVNSRGNAPNNSENIPATLRDEYGISVGASGDNGHIIVQGFNDGSNASSGEIPFSSKYGLDMDVIAPGAYSLHQKTISFQSDTSYESFSATSAAAPQVTGLGAWILNQASFPIAVEDVERLIEYSATDKNTQNEGPYYEMPGYDERSGWGLIDAGATLDLVHSSKVIHVRLTGAEKEFIGSIDSILCSFTYGCPVYLSWTDPDTLVSLGNPINPNYARIWKFSADFFLNVCQEWGVTFQSFTDTSKLPFWILNSLSPFFGPTIPDILEAPSYNETLKLDPWEGSEFQNVMWDSCFLSGTIIGYKYEFTNVDQIGLEQTVFLPSTADEDFFFSILVKADTANLPGTILIEHLVSTQEVAKNASSGLSIWPNPFEEEITVQFPKDINQEGVLQVFNLWGKLLLQRKISALDGQSLQYIPTDLWPSGAYFVHLVFPSRIFSAKALKF